MHLHLEKFHPLFTETSAHGSPSQNKRSLLSFYMGYDRCLCLNHCVSCTMVRWCWAPASVATFVFRLLTKCSRGKRNTGCPLWSDHLWSLFRINPQCLHLSLWRATWNRGNSQVFFHVLGSVDDNQELNINNAPRSQAAFFANMMTGGSCIVNVKRMLKCSAVDSRQMLLYVLGCWKRNRQRPWTSLATLPPPVLAKPHSVLSYSAVQAWMLFI